MREGELLESFQTRVKQLGIEDKVKFLGYRKDVHEIMQCSDVFAFPSKREGLGLASLEAMAAGLPIIGARTRGIVDYVIDGGTGYLCGVKTPQDYANAIERLYSDRDLYEKISNTCKTTALKYDIKNIQYKILQILGELMDN